MGLTEIQCYRCAQVPQHPSPTFSPIFPPNGLREIQFKDFAQVFSRPPLDTPLRQRLTSHLKLFIGELRGLGARGELWINGSYATSKPEPADIDLVLFMPIVTIGSMTDEHKERLEYLSALDNRPYVRAKWNIDFYIRESSDLDGRRYFMDMFSRNPDVQSRKGIPFVRL